MNRILVAGTGKMARNVGARFLWAGVSVHWLARSEQSLAVIEKFAARAIRHATRADPILEGRVDATCSTLSGKIPAGSDAIFESVAENLTAKREVILGIAERAGAHVPVLTNTSSIPPSSIRPDAAGLHFFYPVELTNFAEIIVDGASDAAREAAMGLTRLMGVHSVEETGSGAFAANRCLLPIQNEVSVPDVVCLKSHFRAKSHLQSSPRKRTVKPNPKEETPSTSLPSLLKRKGSSSNQAAPTSQKRRPRMFRRSRKGNLSSSRRGKRISRLA